MLTSGHEPKEGDFVERDRRPSKDELQAARGKVVPDLIAHGLSVLFVGINPGLYTAAIGHHFGRPGNRFWPALHRSGFTPVQLSPFDEGELLRSGIGITNLVARTTATAAELDEEELRHGAELLIAKIARYEPKVVAFLGVEAYRRGFDEPSARVGPLRRRIAGAKVWALPNPSGLNAHYQLPDFVDLFKRVRRSARRT